MKFLHIDFSILGAGSVSRTLASAIVAAQRLLCRGVEVSYRDLAAQPIGHLSGAHLAVGQGAVPEGAALAADVADGANALDAFLAGGKTVIIASSRGGFYGEGSPTAFLDHQETYLKGVFSFFGITDIRFIRADGVALGDEQRGRAVESARAEIDGLAA